MGVAPILGLHLAPQVLEAPHWLKALLRKILIAILRAFFIQSALNKAS